jgi:dihydroorotase
MKTLIKAGRVIDPASGYDEIADVALVDSTLLAIKNIASDFIPDTTINGWLHRHARAG